MRPALPLLLIACVSCVNHDADVSDEGAVHPGVATVKAFFEQLGDEPVHLLVGDLPSETEMETLNWLRQSTARSTGGEFTGFIVRRLNPLSPNSYALRLHRSKGYPELLARKRYVEVHCLHAVSDPEIHGIIDLDEMKVVSIIADGGA